MKRFALIPALLALLLIATCGKVSKNPAGPDNTTQSFSYVIAGRVLDSGSGMSGISVHLIGAGKDTTAITGSNGSYIFTSIPNGSYTLTPTKTDYVFHPASAQSKVEEANTIAMYIQAFVPDFQSFSLAFVPIPGGTFEMGDEVGDLGSDCLPVHMVTVSDFEMGIYEVTNAQYCEYLNAAKVSGDIIVSGIYVNAAKGSYSGQVYLSMVNEGFAYNSWIQCGGDTFTVVYGHENWPVTYVTWYGAKAFALYYGLDLPTEAEWEYACRGGWQYKYGTNDGTISNMKANYHWNIGHPVDVGSYPASPYGLYDMSGNVCEWCHDWFGEYPNHSINNPSGPQTGSQHVSRGSAYRGNGYDCRSAMRYPYNGGEDQGFRVVRRASPQNY